MTGSVGAGVQDGSGRLSFVLCLESSHGEIPVRRFLCIINHNGSPQNKTSSASAAYLSKLSQDIISCLLVFSSAGDALSQPSSS